MENEKISNSGTERDIPVFKKALDVKLIKETLADFFSSIFENFWGLALINLLWFLFAIPLFLLLFFKSRIPFLTFVLLFTAFLMVLSPFTASVFAQTLDLTVNKKMNFGKDFFLKARIYFKKSVFLSIIIAAFFALGIFLYNYSSPLRSPSGSMFFSTIGIIVISITALMQNYLFSILVKYDTSIKNILLNAVYLTFDNLVFNIVIFIVFASVMVIFMFFFSWRHSFVYVSLCAALQYCFKEING